MIEQASRPIHRKKHNKATESMNHTCSQRWIALALSLYALTVYISRYKPLHHGTHRANIINLAAHSHSYAHQNTPLYESTP